MQQIEKNVKANGLALTKVLPKYYKKYSGKYAVYNKGKIEFSNTFENGIKKGDKLFGENAGFVVRKVQSFIPVLSSFVKA